MGSMGFHFAACEQASGGFYMHPYRQLRTKYDHDLQVKCQGHSANALMSPQAYCI